MPKLILVKHSLPEIDPNVPASRWHLGAEGRRRCISLSTALALHHPGRIFTSREPKAIETGKLLATRLGLPSAPADDLHEHRRLTVPFTSQQDFEASVDRFFAEPERLVLGEETATQASTRFYQAVWGLLSHHPQETLIVVSHGTVISLFYQSVSGKDPFPLWQKLGLPAYLVFSLPGLDLVEVVSEPAGVA